MGTYYTSYAMFGVRVPTKHLLIEEMKPRCSHENPPEAKFCAKCGLSTKPEKHVYSDRIMELQEALQEAIPHGYIYAEACVDHPGGSNFFYIGFGLSSDRDNGYKRHKLELGHYPLNTDDILEKLESLLQEEFVAYNLWSDEVKKSFGFYSLTIGR